MLLKVLASLAHTVPIQVHFKRTVKGPGSIVVCNKYLQTVFLQASEEVLLMNQLSLQIRSLKPRPTWAVCCCLRTQSPSSRHTLSCVLFGENVLSCFPICIFTGTLKYVTVFYLCACSMPVPVHSTVCVCRGQRITRAINSLLPLGRSWGLYSGHQAW